MWASKHSPHLIICNLPVLDPDKLSRSQSRGNSFAVCDPVMGDNGALYVKPELVPVYREQVNTHTLYHVFISTRASIVKYRHPIQVMLSFQRTKSPSPDVSLDLVSESTQLLYVAVTWLESLILSKPENQISRSFKVPVMPLNSSSYGSGHGRLSSRVPLEQVGCPD